MTFPKLKEPIKHPAQCIIEDPHQGTPPWNFRALEIKKRPFKFTGKKNGRVGDETGNIKS